jgi:hypothetical protein
MVWYHYSDKPIEKFINDIDCINQRNDEYKPRGLWLSKSTEWKDWLDSEIPEWSRQIKYIYKITLKKKIKVRKIDTLEKLKRFVKKYSYSTKVIYRKSDFIRLNPGEEDIVREVTRYRIDWEKVCKKYDGIFFSNYHKINRIIKNMRWSKNPEYKKYEWYTYVDINSGCIWRPSNVISKILLQH